MVTLALVLFIAGWHLHRLVDVLRDRRRRRLFEEAEAAAPDFPGTPVVGTVKLYDGDGPDAQLVAEVETDEHGDWRYQVPEATRAVYAEMPTELRRYVIVDPTEPPA